MKYILYWFQKLKISLPLIFTLKICIMTIILTGQQSLCYHALLNIILICQILNNVLFHNKKPHPFGIKLSPLCSFCNLYDETPFHIFYERDECLWSDLIKCFQNNLILPTLTPQTVIFGFLDSANNDSIFENNKAFRNHILSILMLYVYM